MPSRADVRRAHDRIARARDRRQQRHVRGRPGRAAAAAALQGSRGARDDLERQHQVGGEGQPGVSRQHRSFQGSALTRGGRSALLVPDAGTGEGWAGAGAGACLAGDARHVLAARTATGDRWNLLREGCPPRRRAQLPVLAASNGGRSERGRPDAEHQRRPGACPDSRRYAGGLHVPVRVDARKHRIYARPGGRHVVPDHASARPPPRRRFRTAEPVDPLFRRDRTAASRRLHRSGPQRPRGDRGAARASSSRTRTRDGA